MWPSAWPARPETVRQSTPPATSWVTMKCRRSCRRARTPRRAASSWKRCVTPWGQARPDGQRGLDLPQAIGPDELHSVRTDGHSALGVGLGVLVDQRPACDADHAAGDEDLAVVQVDIAPLEAAELSPARTEDHGQAQEEAEFRILFPCHFK